MDSSSDNDVQELFKMMMSRCRQERKNKTDSTVREVAKKLGKTENYLSSVENGREFPSLKTFINYLLINNFDIEPLLKLSISEESDSMDLTTQKSELADKIYSLNEDQVIYMVKQAEIAEGFKLKSKKDK